jgi:hypothetical protein
MVLSGFPADVSEGDQIDHHRAGGARGRDSVVRGLLLRMGRPSSSGPAGPMLEAAVEGARSAGAQAIEGYPVDTEGGTKPGALYTGTIELYERNGFEERLRPASGRRVVMQRVLAD